jgi:hypothetical protein
MSSLTIKEITVLKPTEQLKAFNQLTELTWDKYPDSLLPNGLIINGNDNYIEQCSGPISRAE